jgi:hypothetical protein
MSVSVIMRVAVAVIMSVIMSVIIIALMRVSGTLMDTEFYAFDVTALLAFKMHVKVS